jgi:hypothetical protein
MVRRKCIFVDKFQTLEIQALANDGFAVFSAKLMKVIRVDHGTADFALCTTVALSMPLAIHLPTS